MGGVFGRFERGFGSCLELLVRLILGTDWGGFNGVLRCVRLLIGGGNKGGEG